METNILNLHHRVCLKSMGNWPGVQRTWPVVTIVVMTIFSNSAAYNNLKDNYHDLALVSQNIVGTLGAITVTLQLVYFKLNRR